MSEENKSVRGCLIERKGRYYVIISYYCEDHRIQETKSTGIAVNSHQKRKAEDIMNQIIQEKKKALENFDNAEALKTTNNTNVSKAANNVKVLHSFADCAKRFDCILRMGIERRA